MDRLGFYSGPYGEEDLLGGGDSDAPVGVGSVED